MLSCWAHDEAKLRFRQRSPLSTLICTIDAHNRQYYVQMHYFGLP